MRLQFVLLWALATTCSAKIHGRPSITGHGTTYTGCTIKNKIIDNYLYAAGNPFNYNKDSRRVFLWTASWSSGFVGNKWDLWSPNGGETWAIGNKEFGDYLSTDSDSKALKKDGGGKRRQVYDYPKLDTGRGRGGAGAGMWKLDSVDGGKYVTVFNAGRREYLFADGESVWDEARRRVFTWARKRPRGYMWEESKWRIDCA